MQKLSQLATFKLTEIIQRGYKVHFLKGPAADTIFSQFEQKQLFNLITTTQKEDSYQIFNPQKTITQIKNWKNQLDWINPFYAIKANPSNAQLELMKKENLGFDCASEQEISKVISLNVNPSKIILSNSIKKKGDLEFARLNNVNLTTADTLNELHKIKAYHPNCEILWRIAIPEIHQQKLATTFSKKFGDDLLTAEDMQARFKEIKDLGFNLEGLHFHCGSGALGSENFSFALDIAQQCMTIARNIGHKMRILDLGGGFPAGQLPLNLIQILQRLKNDKNIEKIMAEPGRHFATNPFTMVCHVIGKRNKGGLTMYHLNDGLYHMMNCVLMDGMSIGQNSNDWYAQWENNEGKSIKNLEEGTLVGMTCDGLDIISQNIKVPKMEIGDAIVINAMGAYTTGPVSHFNGMKVQEKAILWEPKLEEDDIKIFEKAKLELCF